LRLYIPSNACTIPRVKWVPTACGAGGGGGSNPPVAGYVAWYDATKITGQADNTPLSSWLDLSGNGNNLSLNLTAPTYYSSTAGKLFNGKPAVWFASNELKTTTLVTVPQPLTFFMMVAYTGGGTTSWEYVIDGVLNDITLGLNAGNYGLFAGGGWISDTTTPAPENGTLHNQCGIYNGATSTIFVDGISRVTGGTGTNGLDNFLIGGVSNSAIFNGAIAEILVYPSALSTVNRQSVESYLRAKWGTP
jgi:Concanavalin A-like lectin/glucanases superfamily